MTEPAISVFGATLSGNNPTITVAGQGSFVYTPSLGYIGSDRFTYTATDPGTGLTSSAAVVSAPDNRVRRRLPFRPNITSVLPACMWLRTGDARRRRRITHFVFGIFRYPGRWVVSPRL